MPTVPRRPADRRRRASRTASTRWRTATGPIRHGLGPGRPAAHGLPAGVHRRVPVEHRQLDAERRARRAGLRPHALADVRRRAAVRPARPAAAVLAGRRAAGRRLRPAPAPHHRVGPAGRSCRSRWPWVARVDDPSRVGAGRRSCSSSAWARPCSARPTARLLPALVGREDLPGAISLNSAQMNGSRVIGPVIGAAVLDAQVGAGVGVRRQRRVLPARDLVAAQRPAAPAGAGHRAGCRASAGCWPGFQVARRRPGRRPVPRSSSSRSRCCRCPSSARCRRWPTATSASTPDSTQYGCSTPASASARCSARCRSARCSPTASLERVVRVGLVAFAGVPGRVLAAALARRSRTR